MAFWSACARSRAGNSLAAEGQGGEKSSPSEEMGRTGKSQGKQDSAQDPYGGAGSVLKKDFSLGRHERLRRQKDFQLALRHGSRRHTKNFTIILRPNALEFSRLGVTVGKKVGNAVKRNRVKRYLREFFRLHKHKLPPSNDLVIIAKEDAATLAYHDVREELAAVLIKDNCL
jgi:ribonuclease P protein component